MSDMQDEKKTSSLEDAQDTASKEVPGAGAQDHVDDPIRQDPGAAQEEEGGENPEASQAEDTQKTAQEGARADGTEAEGYPESGSQDPTAAEEAQDVVDGEWTTAEDGGIKGLFRKKEKKDKKDLQIEELTDRVRRQMAEFDNFRKRTEKEKSTMYEVGAKSVIEKILPVVDNFERGLAAAENAEDPFVDGMSKTYKLLMTTLEGMEVKPIEAVGAQFDPDLHNAVMHVDDENAGENEIVEEFQKGYTYRGSVVRYSMVKVAN